MVAHTVKLCEEDQTAVPSEGGSEVPCTAQDAVPEPKTYKIVMIRHGESEWNKENRFCGWFDSGLSEKGNVFKSQ